MTANGTPRRTANSAQCQNHGDASNSVVLHAAQKEQSALLHVQACCTKQLALIAVQVVMLVFMLIRHENNCCSFVLDQILLNKILTVTVTDNFW